MDGFSDFEIFARVVTSGSMSNAAREAGCSPAVVSKRIRRLEERLGTRLLQRTTRQIALTEVGQGFYERVVAILAGIEEAESWASSGSSAVRGVLRVTAPTSFGRLHIAPHLPAFLKEHPELTIDLELSDAYVDLVADGFDLAVRIGELENSSLVAKRLAPSHRVLCASPAHLEAFGRPRSLADLARHPLLAHNTDQWRLEGPGGPVTVRVDGPLRTNSSEVVREAVIAGLGIALRSTWDVGPELRAGTLERVLPDHAGSRSVGVFAVYPSRRHLARKVRVFIDRLAELYGPVPPWDLGLGFETPAAA